LPDFSDFNLIAKFYLKFSQQELKFLANLEANSLPVDLQGKLGVILENFRNFEKNEHGNWCCNKTDLKRPEIRTRINKKTQTQEFNEFYVVECPLWSAEGCPMYRTAYG
jgi:hypothetical protein